jgi:hypothetical protein
MIIYIITSELHYLITLRLFILLLLFKFGDL